MRQRPVNGNSKITEKLVTDEGKKIDQKLDQHLEYVLYFTSFWKAAWHVSDVGTSLAAHGVSLLSWQDSQSLCITSGFAWCFMTVKSCILSQPMTFNLSCGKCGSMFEWYVPLFASWTCRWQCFRMLHPTFTRGKFIQVSSYTNSSSPGSYPVTCKKVSPFLP